MAAPRRTRSQAKSRLELSALEGEVNIAGGDLGDATLSTLLEQFQEYIPGMIQTLGIAAQPTTNVDGSVTPGDVDAAKKALDFLGKALAGNKSDSRATETLREIARIRAGSA